MRQFQKSQLSIASSPRDDLAFTPHSLQYNRQSILAVQRNGSAYASPLEYIQNDHIYYGEENVLILSQTYTTSFTCKYDMGAYPFDVQKCSMIFVLEVKISNIE